ncbi:MAG: hypothetical protein AAF916_07765 [Planctomycetota bacterium]
MEHRLKHRTFPSVFQAWNGIDPLPAGMSELEAVAKHDLFWHEAWWFGLQTRPDHLVRWETLDPVSLKTAEAKVAELRRLNPNLVVLIAVRYRDAPADAMPVNDPWWKRNIEGQRVMSWEEGGYLKLDVDAPAFRDAVAQQAAAYMDTGLFDGLFFDWWFDAVPNRRALMEAVREAVPDDTLILVNANANPLKHTGDLVNGSFMECDRSGDWSAWSKMEASLVFNERAVRSPRINALSAWWATGRNELDRARAATTLVLTRSDGFVLFSDPNGLPTPDHRHNWYPMWDVPLGRPLADGRMHADGSVRREFTNGWAIYNRPGNGTARIEFKEPYRSVRTSRVHRSHTVPPADGDLLLRVRPSLGDP